MNFLLPNKFEITFFVLIIKKNINGGWQDTYVPFFFIILTQYQNIKFFFNQKKKLKIQKITDRSIQIN